MIINYLRNRKLKWIARMLLLIFIVQIISPLQSFALTTGPSQPEIQSFEPVGTTDLVDHFTGAFNYNIPLLNVDGYPINIAYHSGVTMEQEASWVGLGWNLNPGCINRLLRGVPDDFNGDRIEKTLDIEPEVTKTYSMLTGVEFIGYDKAGKSTHKGVAGFGVNFSYVLNNYSGVSASISPSLNFTVPNSTLGVNLSFTSNTASGFDVDGGVSYNLSTKSGSASKINQSSGLGINGGLNSQEGAKQWSFSASPSLSQNKGEYIKPANAGMNYTYTPIGFQNYYPVVTNTSTVRSSFYQIKIGGEIFAVYPYGGGGLGKHVVEYSADGSRDAYGYFNMQNATESDILDFTRDKDGAFNKHSRFLPPATMTYDVLNVSGQGTGGSFRPFRNDIGTVYDPTTHSNSFDHSHVGEIGFGNVFELGYDFNMAMTNMSSGPVYKKPFNSSRNGDLFEPYYFKQSGELTPPNHLVANSKPWSRDDIIKPQNFDNVVKHRVKRSNLLYFYTPWEASKKQISPTPQLENWNFNGYPSLSNPTLNKSVIDRPDYNNKNSVKASEYVQVQPNGQRYIYGLPVMNTKKVDYELSVSGTPNAEGLIDVGINNNEFEAESNATNKYFTKTSTPSYAHAYLLTAVLSSDYVDLTGDGLTPDDLGTYTKFNYRKSPNNYIWRSPYEEGKAIYNPGIKSNCRDDKAVISIGEREVWTLHSIEGKEQVAVFYTSDRLDAHGASNQVVGGSSNTPSIKLDKIVLYNRSDENIRLIDEDNPVKTISFAYNYSLCRSLPNTSGSSLAHSGKLTLSKIYTSYGKSDIGYMSPYSFTYYGNAMYSNMAKDCWGTYKANSSNSQYAGGLGMALNNMDFPYVNQKDPMLDEYASEFNLKEIILPSGGKIHITYEADDYAYVQDQEAMEMFRVEGIGSSPNYGSNNLLYEGLKSPNCFIYFKRRVGEEANPSNLLHSYFGSEKTVQCNFEVLLSDGFAGQCPSQPLFEKIKCYAKILEVNPCPNNADYAYVQIEPKKPHTFLGINKEKQKVAVNPITYAALNFGRYYANSSIRPETNISVDDGEEAIMKNLMNTGLNAVDAIRNPIKALISKQKAKKCDIGKSYVRLKSPSGIKKGGGERVKRIEYSDVWKGSTTEGTYGQEYRYTMEGADGRVISSGVASYEPLIGGDENPCKKLLLEHQASKIKQFPPVDPIYLLQEEPIGESFYPPATVGYSKVTIMDIHQNVGASVQSASTREFYTAKDFPVKVDYTEIQMADPTQRNLFSTTHSLIANQGFSIFLNDMHGKLKKESVLRILDPLNPMKGEEESYTHYIYFTNGNELDNQVPCLAAAGGGLNNGVELMNKTLGEEVDYTVDSRYKDQNTFNLAIMLSTNSFVIPPIPVALPSVFFNVKQKNTHFESLSSTKIIQRYGILKEVQQMNKQSLVKVSNTAFDENTGEVLLSKVSTEHADEEHTIKYPGYWAYKNMGNASDNVLYEEDVSMKSYVQNDKFYFQSDHPENFNIGDELLLDYSRSCPTISTAPQYYKLWVTNKNVQVVNSLTSCSNVCGTSGTNPVVYNEVNTLNCMSQSDFYSILNNLLHTQNLFNTASRIPEKIHVLGPSSPLVFVNDYYDCINNQTLADVVNPYGLKLFEVELDPSYTSTDPIPHSSPYITTKEFTLFKQAHYVHQRNGFIGTFTDPPEQYMKIMMEFPSNSAIDNLTFPNLNSAVSTFSTNTIYKTCFWGIGSASSYLEGWRYVTESQGTTSPRPGNSAVSFIEAKVLKTNSDNINSISNPVVPFPSGPTELRYGKVKILRSGKRNLLNETIEEVTSLDNPINSTNNLKTTLNQALASSSREYTYKADFPSSTWNQAWYNEFVTGYQGNFRVQEEHIKNVPRVYTGATIHSDKQKGTFPYTLYWVFGTPSAQPDFWNAMHPNTTVDPTRVKTYEVTKYSHKGQDCEVQDAQGNIYSNLYGYHDTRLTATAKNSEYTNILSESFEDYAQKYYGFMLLHPANPLRTTVMNQLGANQFSGTDFKISNVAHTGKYSLECINNSVVVLNSSHFNSNQVLDLASFYFKGGQDYLINYWQYVGNTGTPANGAISFTVANISGITLSKPKTPNIEGWVQYEAKITIPPMTFTSSYDVSFHFAGGVKVDDLRVFPGKSNMKSYVYHPDNKNLVAILDENNMASLFEYDDQKKLVRIKKETEKGILTLKESRESLQNIIHQLLNNNNLSEHMPPPSLPAQ